MTKIEQGLRRALLRSKQALDDWIRTYASDFCKPEHTAESAKRIRDGGGTLAYVAGVQEESMTALLASGQEPNYGILVLGEIHPVCYEEMVEILAAIRDTPKRGNELFDDAKEKACRILRDHVPDTDY